MKKTTAGTTAPVAKKRSATKAGDRGKAKSAAPVAKRKKNSAAGAGKMTQIMKKAALKPTRALSASSNGSDKAHQVGRAVGTILGKAIGNVERVVSRVMKSARTTKK